MTCLRKIELGSYVLDALEPAERSEVDAHLATCADCRAELDELAGLPAVLSRVTLDDLVPASLPVPDELFERVAARARAEHQALPAADVPAGRRRQRRLLAAAAALAVLAGGGIGAWAALGSSAGPAQSSTTARDGIRMNVRLAAQTTGTRYTVTVTGLPTDEHCTLVAIADNGRRDIAGRWDATYEGQANQTGSTSIPRAQLARLVLLGTHGEQLAAVRV